MELNRLKFQPKSQLAILNFLPKFCILTNQRAVDKWQSERERREKSIICRVINHIICLMDIKMTIKIRLKIY